MCEFQVDELLDVRPDSQWIGVSCESECLDLLDLVSVYLIR